MTNVCSAREFSQQVNRPLVPTTPYEPLNAQNFYQSLGLLKTRLILGLMDSSGQQTQIDLAHIEAIQAIQNKLMDKLNPIEDANRIPRRPADYTTRSTE